MVRGFVLDPGKKNLLVRLRAEFPESGLPFIFTQIRRTFGDYDDLRSPAAASDIPERSGRQQTVPAIQMIIRGEKDIESGPYFPVLKCII
jgi:hypothetical protein